MKAAERGQAKVEQGVRKSVEMREVGESCGDQQGVRGWPRKDEPVKTEDRDR